MILQDQYLVEKGNDIQPFEEMIEDPKLFKKDNKYLK